jgi:argininosuccinate lyase
VTLWQGRIGGTSAPELWALSKSLHVDGRLALDDVRASELENMNEKIRV